MYFTSDSMLPENQQPLIITVAPYGPQWLPSDYPEDIPVTWEEQTQKAVDCYKAGASVLHWYDTAEQTLASLGLPPNRKDGQLGFIVKETDGRPHAPIVGSDSHPIAGQIAA